MLLQVSMTNVMYALINTINEFSANCGRVVMLRKHLSALK